MVDRLKHGRTRPNARRNSDSRTWELAAPTIDASSSLCLPHSTNLWQSSEEEAMSWWGIRWGPPAPTFWDHCAVTDTGLNHSCNTASSSLLLITDRPTDRHTRNPGLLDTDMAGYPRAGRGPRYRWERPALRRNRLDRTDHTYWKKRGQGRL